MEIFKIKSEAKQFFDKSIRNEIKPLKFWAKNSVYQNALEKVEKVYLTYGIAQNSSLNNICGWSGLNNDAKFHFTINVNDITNETYHIIKDDELMSDLMGKIQTVINSHINENLPF